MDILPLEIVDNIIRKISDSKSLNLLTRSCKYLHEIIESPRNTKYILKNCYIKKNILYTFVCVLDDLIKIKEILQNKVL